ncbi:MAG: hypothetical protein ACRENM_02650 [Candidatus Dormibacteraceae bacterium]
MTLMQPAEPSPERYATKFSAPIIELDLVKELAEIRAGAAYGVADHAAMTLVNEENLRVVLIALRAQGRMHQHRAHAPIVLQALEGSVRLGVGERTLDLRRGGLMAIDAGLPHDVEALEESALLLVIGGTGGHSVE